MTPVYVGVAAGQGTPTTPVLVGVAVAAGQGTPLTPVLVGVAAVIRHFGVGESDDARNRDGGRGGGAAVGVA
jgi:hypothetical protein